MWLASAAYVPSAHSAHRYVAGDPGSVIGTTCSPAWHTPQVREPNPRSIQRSGAAQTGSDDGSAALAGSVVAVLPSIVVPKLGAGDAGGAADDAGAVRPLVLGVVTMIAVAEDADVAGGGGAVVELGGAGVLGTVLVSLVTALVRVVGWIDGAAVVGLTVVAGSNGVVMVGVTVTGVGVGSVVALVPSVAVGVVVEGTGVASVLQTMFVLAVQALTTAWLVSQLSRHGAHWVAQTSSDQVLPGHTRQRTPFQNSPRLQAWVRHARSEVSVGGRNSTVPACDEHSRVKHSGMHDIAAQKKTHSAHSEFNRGDMKSGGGGQTPITAEARGELARRHIEVTAVESGPRSALKWWWRCRHAGPGHRTLYPTVGTPTVNPL